MTSIFFSLKILTICSIAITDSIEIQMSDTAFNVNDEITFQIVNHTKQSFSGFVSLEAYDADSTDRLIIEGTNWIEIVQDVTSNRPKGLNITNVEPNGINTLKGKFISEIYVNDPYLKMFRFVFYYFKEEPEDGIKKACQSKAFIMRREVKK